MIVTLVLLMLLGCAIGGAIVFFISAKKYSNEDSKYDNSRGEGRRFDGALCLVVATIVLAITIATCVGWYSSAYQRKAQLINFYQSNSANYADAMNGSNNILLQAKFLGGFGDIGVGLTYQNQSQAVTQALIDWRDAVNEYNSDLAGYKASHTNLVTNWFYPSINLEPLSIK